MKKTVLVTITKEIEVDIIDELLALHELKNLVPICFNLFC